MYGCVYWGRVARHWPRKRAMRLLNGWCFLLRTHDAFEIFHGLHTELHSCIFVTNHDGLSVYLSNKREPKWVPWMQRGAIEQSMHREARSARRDNRTLACICNAEHVHMWLTPSSNALLRAAIEKNYNRVTWYTTQKYLGGEWSTWEGEIPGRGWSIGCERVAEVMMECTLYNDLPLKIELGAAMNRRP